MKAFISFALVLCIGAAVKSEDVCHTVIENACNSKTLSATQRCNSKYGGIDHIEGDVQAYINHQLTKSYEYLLLATNFDSYQMNRPGFRGLYQKLSDKAFDDTIEVIKHITNRGGKHDFNAVHEPIEINKQPIIFDSKVRDTLEVDELHSLAIALDNEKDLSNNALHVHSQATHTPYENRDAAIAHYFEEKFLLSQVDTIRKISGYANDLAQMMNNNNDRSLAVYLFDQYLQKQ